MKFTRTSWYSGITRTVEIAVTPDQVKAWENGTLIQDAMPNISNSEREFIKSGITSDEWDCLYPGEEF